MGIVLLNILLTFFVTSCGDIEIPEQNQQKENDESTETRDIDNENIPKNGTNTHVTVAVDVDVDITQAPENAPEYVLNTVQVTWETARNNAPQGYKLMTRAEILFALESGDLDVVLHQDAVVWTDTEYQNDEMSYFYSHQDQATTPGLKMLRFGSVYKKVDIHTMSVY